MPVIRRSIGGATVGLALGRREGRANSAHANAPRVIRAPGLVTVWFRYSRVWRADAR